MVGPVLHWVVQFFLYLLEALIVSLVIYPILLCLQSQRGLLRNSIGLLYSVPWLVFCIGNIVLSAVPCKQTNVDQLDPVVEILQGVVLYGSGTICFFALVIRFLLGLIKNMRNGFGMSIFKGFLEIPDAPTPDFKKTHFYIRVKYLLTPTVQQKMSENIVLYLFQKYIGTVPGFRFSRHNICTFILTAVVTVQVVLWWSGVNGRLLYFYSTLQLPTLPQMTVQKITITFWVSSVVALIFTVACTIDMQLRYRKHTLMLWRGDRSFCPKQKRSFSVMMVASLRYPAYHVAYSLWGFIVIQILMWIILQLIVLLWDSVSLYLLKRYWLAFVIAFAFYYGQILVARLVFLQRALDPAGTVHIYLLQKNVTGFGQQTCLPRGCLLPAVHQFHPRFNELLPPHPESPRLWSSVHRTHGQTNVDAGLGTMGQRLRCLH
ncbi:uncharacterized protein LOC110986625 isoform X2 [Acanthaster planci]|uniref:Uncharacterized protein LOC110986625 isoform X2 n=1 Tax=Acanthaster planci TaxID=133434 RepID=A0A8B7ZFD5_ACAPL|nr:uncharacterized protein LOC110986625 isoform X2 [Acanthaster planci]